MQKLTRILKGKINKQKSNACVLYRKKILGFCQVVIYIWCIQLKGFEQSVRCVILKILI